MHCVRELKHLLDRKLVIAVVIVDNQVCGFCNACHFHARTKQCIYNALIAYILWTNVFNPTGYIEIILPIAFLKFIKIIT